jgi:hypothetical protein
MRFFEQKRQEFLKKTSTHLLLRLLHILRVNSSMFIYNDWFVDLTPEEIKRLRLKTKLLLKRVYYFDPSTKLELYFKESELKNELKLRPHIPNKQERRKARLEKIALKGGRGRKDKI